jgi:RNA polymerase sigma factor (sigma-70 family)
MLQSKPHIDRLRLPPDDQRTGINEPDWTIWPTTHRDEEPVAAEIEADEGQPQPGVSEFDPETDSLVAQYFGDVRHFDLLTRAQEEALWQHIELLKQRVRRALYTAPVCLPTLQTLWQEVVGGERLLHDVVAETTALADDGPAPFARFEAAILSLQELMPCLQHLKTRQRVDHDAATQRVRRQTQVDLWQQWIATCEALRLQPGVHEALHLALDTALLERPDDAALRTARSGWHRATRALEEAKAKMLRANLRLVIYVAKRFRHDDVPFIDLIQEGNIGLIRALEKFDSSRGLKFVTYAHWWVRQAIGRAIDDQSRTIRLPSHVVERKNKLRAAETKLWQVYKRVPNTQELGVELGWTPQEVETLQDTRQVMVRLHEPLSEDGQLFEEMVEDEQSLEPDVVVSQRELQERLADCLSDLTEREADILRLRFGLDTDQAHRLKEIGDLYGLSRERLRQLETIALNKLRDSKRCAMLADFVDVA